jgi:putative two-component system response regulator
LSILKTPVFPEARILIVDDEEANVRLLERLLRSEGYSQIRTTTDSSSALEIFGEMEPDLLILDLHMPFPDGFVLLEHVNNSTPQSAYLPILILTGDVTEDAKNRALVLGAKDFLTKPFSVLEARYRVRNLLRTRRMHLELQDQVDYTERQVASRLRSLEHAQLQVLERVANTAEFRGAHQDQHTRRVGAMSGELARMLGLPNASVEMIRDTAPLHDIGHIGIPEAIILKPGRLTPEEFEILKTHTTIGANLLSDSTSEAMGVARQIALGHHERWDGNGYPLGRRGDEIPISARIVALADFVDVMTHDRPHRTASSLGDVLEGVRSQAGGHFDPDVAETFLVNHDRLMDLAPAAT